MPSTRKKSPSEAKKKSLRSTKSKSSVKKSTRKTKVTELNDGSYLQSQATVGHQSTQENVSTVLNASSNSIQEETLISTNQAILSMLQKIDDSNQALTKHMDELERQNAISSTPVASPTRPDPRASHFTSVHQGQVTTSGTQANAAISQAIPVTHRSTVHNNPIAVHASAQGVIRESGQGARDAIAPRLEVMRSIPSISSAVSQLLARYDDQADQDAMPGKGHNYRKKSGRYNVTDTSMVSPQFRWPNEGLISNSHLKKPSYDELNMAQWVSGQLNNVLLIEDNVALRNVLTQVTMAMRDAVSLPWAAVRAAWAVSMTDIEEGRLAWNDSMQWSLNRISNSQLAMHNSNTAATGGQKVKICKFFNEGSCTNEGHHGIYKHFCMFCHRQGRSLVHPEMRCTARSSTRTQDQKTSAK